MRRAAVTMMVLALLSVTAACGDDGDDETSEEARAGVVDDTTPGGVETDGEDEADGTGGEGSDGGTGSGDDVDGADGETAGAPAVEVCEVLGVDTVADASGLSLVAGGVNIGGGLYGDVEFDARGCKYLSAEETDEVIVKLLVEPAGGAEAAFTAIEAESAASSFDDYPHEVVEGLGDGAFFAAGLRSADLWVLAGDDVLFIKGESNDEPLDTATLQAVGTAAVAALG